MSPGSIYRSSEGEAELMALYDEALAGLGADFESRMVGTSFGETHVLVTGPEDAPPLLVFQDGNFLNPLQTYSRCLRHIDGARLTEK